MVIAVDFDGTIVEHAIRHRKPIPFAIDTSCYKRINTLILWTVRGATVADAMIIVRTRTLPKPMQLPGGRTMVSEVGSRPFIDDRNPGCPIGGYLQR